MIGSVEFSRYSLIPENTESKKKLFEISGVKSIYPLDEYLGISKLPFKITASAMLRIAYWSQNQSSYQRAEDTVYEIMGIRLNDDTMREVTNYVGGVVFQNDCERAEEAYSRLCEGKLAYQSDKKGVLYIQADGSSLNTRNKDENGSTWRENKLGEVFTSKDIHCWTDKKGNRQHRLLKREYISYIGSVDEFKKHLLVCAIRGGYGDFKETVVIGDGATWIRNMVDELFPDAQQILDYYHLCENVYIYSKYMHGTEVEKYKNWAKEICQSLRASKYDEVLAELGALKDKNVDGCPVNLHGYISNNIKNIDYAEYERRGYFIGSGAIESGNKIIVQDRLKRAGMRWNVPTAQAMLTLRAKAESDRWHTDVVLPFLCHCTNLHMGN